MVYPRVPPLGEKLSLDLTRDSADDSRAEVVVRQLLPRLVDVSGVALEPAKGALDQPLLGALEAPAEHLLDIDLVHGVVAEPLKRVDERLLAEPREGPSDLGPVFLFRPPKGVPRCEGC